MVLNNLFYVTVKFGDDHPKELEDVWAELCTCWPTNLRVILRYLFIVTGMAPTELLAYVWLWHSDDDNNPSLFLFIFALLL